MKKKAFQKYVDQNHGLKKWMKENEDWVRSNPDVVRSMINRLPSKQSTPSSIAPNNYYPRSRSRSLGGGLGSLFSRNRRALSKINLNNISQATQQLTKTFGMIENLQTILNVMKLR